MEHGERARAHEFEPDEATLAALRFQSLRGEDPENLESANQAFEQVVKLTYPKILDAAHGSVHHDNHAAADIVQETYLKAYRAMSRNRFHGNSQVSTWLYRILINNVKNHYERQSRQLSREASIEQLQGYEGYDPADLHDTEANYVTEEAAKEILDRLKNSKMTDVDRIIWHMAEVEHRKHDEIVTTLALGGIATLSIAALKMRLHRARKKASQAL